MADILDQLADQDKKGATASSATPNHMDDPDVAIWNKKSDGPADAGFLGEFWKNLPHPMNMLQGVLGSMQTHQQAANTEYGKGNYGNAFLHLMAGANPMIGMGADQAQTSLNDANSLVQQAGEGGAGGERFQETAVHGLPMVGPALSTIMQQSAAGNNAAAAGGGLGVITSAAMPEILGKAEGVPAQIASTSDSLRKLGDAPGGNQFITAGGELAVAPLAALLGHPGVATLVGLRGLQNLFRGWKARNAPMEAPELSPAGKTIMDQQNNIGPTAGADQRSYQPGNTVSRSGYGDLQNPGLPNYEGPNPASMPTAPDSYRPPDLTGLARQMYAEGGVATTPRGFGLSNPGLPEFEGPLPPTKNTPGSMPAPAKGQLTVEQLEHQSNLDKVSMEYTGKPFDQVKDQLSKFGIQTEVTNRFGGPKPSVPPPGPNVVRGTRPLTTDAQLQGTTPTTAPVVPQNTAPIHPDTVNLLDEQGNFNPVPKPATLRAPASREAYNMRPVESASGKNQGISAAGHHEPTQTQLVEFHNGGSVVEHGVSAAQHEQMMQAKSPTAYYNSSIKTRPLATRTVVNTSKATQSKNLQNPMTEDEIKAAAKKLFGGDQ